MLRFEDPISLSLLYHLNSEPWLNTEAYEALPYEVQYKEMAGADRMIPLPPPTQSPLLRLLEARRSCRQYDPRPMPVDTLAAILAGAYGILRTSMLADGINAFFRGVPSAGGLFPFEIYVLARSVAGVPDGLQHYNVRKHALEPLADGPPLEEIHGALLTDPFAREANVIILLAAVFTRTQRKYGPRGYRYILLEAGHIAQAICLLATERGLGSLCMGGFLDGRLNRSLGLDGVGEAVLYAVAVGHPGQV